VIHQTQTSAKPGFLHRRQHRLHFGAGQNHRQGLRFGNAQFLEDRPLFALEALHVEAQQRVLGPLHQRRRVMLFLAQEQEILAKLVFVQRGGIALEMLG
jgi:hypothetical protein